MKDKLLKKKIQKKMGRKREVENKTAMKQMGFTYHETDGWILKSFDTFNDKNPIMFPTERAYTPTKPAKNEEDEDKFEVDFGNEFCETICNPNNESSKYGRTIKGGSANTSASATEGEAKTSRSKSRGTVPATLTAAPNVVAEALPAQVVQRRIRTCRKTGAASAVAVQNRTAQGTFTKKLGASTKKRNRTTQVAHPARKKARRTTRDTTLNTLPDTDLTKECLRVHAMHKELCSSIPFATAGSFRESLADRVEVLNDNLLKALQESKETLKNAHKGISLATTTAPGGKYGKRSKSSGSIHWSEFLRDNLDLQREVLEVTALVINQAYGRKRWYRRLMSFFRHPKNQYMRKFFLPGIPCTHIWWSTETRSNNWHIDPNEIGAGFLFVSKSYTGGDLVLNHPTLPLQAQVHLDRCDVVAGRFSRCYHFNSMLDASEGRRTSFKAYLDSRAVNVNYQDRRNFRKKGKPQPKQAITELIESINKKYLYL